MASGCEQAGWGVEIACMRSPESLGVDRVRVGRLQHRVGAESRGWAAGGCERHNLCRDRRKRRRAPRSRKELVKGRRTSGELASLSFAAANTQNHYQKTPGPQHWLSQQIPALRREKDNWGPEIARTQSPELWDVDMVRVAQL